LSSWWWGGARIRLLKEFVGAPSWNRPDLVEQLTPEVWALALYHTFIDSLVGILWLLLILGLVFATALIVLRRSTNQLEMVAIRTGTREERARYRAGGSHPLAW
jgi:hypothetical protein